MDDEQGTHTLIPAVRNVEYYNKFDKHNIVKIAIVGTRGIPAKYGGFETFAQEVSKRLVKRGVEVTVVCPATEKALDSVDGVKLIYTKGTKDHKPMNYYMESVKLALSRDFDIILMCGQGGYAYIPFLHKAKSKRPVFITNTDGIEHRRTKWNKMVRLGVRIVGEMTSVLFSDVLVADSKGIKQYLSKEYKRLPSRPTYVIEYGAEVLDKSQYPETLITEYGVRPDDYHLVVARLEPENNVRMIIEGYKLAKTHKPLIIVGNLKDTDFIKEIKELAEDHNIRFVGGVYDPEKLKALRLYSYSYLHGHSVGGTNPSLLEALGAGNIVIGHDNPFNREVTDNRMFYFSSPEECARVIEKVDALSKEERERLSEIGRNRIDSYYNWDRIADEYARMFNEVKK